MSFGHRDFVVKSENEVALQARIEAAVGLLPPGRTAVHEKSPVGEHQSKGVAERARGTAQGQCRTISSAFERLLLLRPPDFRVVSSSLWLVDSQFLYIQMRR